MVGREFRCRSSRWRMRNRPDFDSYFLGIAEAVSLRGDCRRRQVGAVLVDKENRIISTGYNGTEPGGPSCLKGQCPRGLLSHAEMQPDAPYTNCIASHAEANCLLYAGRDKAKGCTLYVTDEPCHECRRLIRAAGVERVVVKRPAAFIWGDD
jgi:dCMP deaminase